MREELFVVRLYDGFDHEWMDVSDVLPHDEAKKIWNQRTMNGTYKTKFEDIDYFAIFPANTVMRFSEEGRNL